METKENTRKAYKKPQITQVELVIEEAVLQACKTSDTTAGQVNKTCMHQKCQKTIGS